MLEARCTKCGETFNPEDSDDLTHWNKDDGTECDGTGELTGMSD